MKNAEERVGEEYLGPKSIMQIATDVQLELDETYSNRGQAIFCYKPLLGRSRGWEVIVRDRENKVVYALRQTDKQRKEKEAIRTFPRKRRGKVTDIRKSLYQTLKYWGYQKG